MTDPGPDPADFADRMAAMWGGPLPEVPPPPTPAWGQRVALKHDFDEYPAGSSGTIELVTWRSVTGPGGLREMCDLAILLDGHNAVVHVSEEAVRWL